MSQIPKRAIPIAIFLVMVGVFGVCVIGSASIMRAQSAESENAAPPDFFIEAEVDNLKPYLGQQITYTLRRYQAADFPNQPHYEEHPFAGFWDIPLIQRPSFTATISGREYLVHPTHIALFPTLPGPVTIDPARLVIPSDGPQADILLETEPIYLEVHPLPEGAPLSFGGAVGQFELTAKFSESEVQLNQPATLVVEVWGTGNIERVAEPRIPLMQNWRFPGTSGSEVTTNIPLSKDLVTGSRRFEWSLLPAEAGQQFFPGIDFSYFDPQTETYHSLRTDTISISVLPLEGGSAFVSPVPELRQAVRRLASDIRHIKPAPTAVTVSVEPAQFRYAVLAGCAMLSLLAVGGARYWRYRQKCRADTSPEARRRRARQRARTALSATDNSLADPFLTVHDAVTGYLEDKLNQPVVGLTSDQLIDRLNTAQLQPDLVERVRSLLERVETGRYAPISEEQTSSRSLVASARVLIDDLEQYFSRYAASK